MQRQLRRAYTALKERGSVSYARISTMGGFCDLECIIIKATSPHDSPLSDRYINQLLKIFSISPSSSFQAFSLAFPRRFSRTQCWRVALKCLILLHRLLRLLPQNSPFRAELLWARSNGLLSLYPCRFNDSSASSFSEDYTIFIRSYAALLDEALDCFSIYTDDIEQGGEEGMVVPETLPEKMKEFGRVIELLPQLQSLIDRVLDCQPTVAASRNFLVQSAMKLIIRDSFVCYTCFRKELVVVLESLLQLPYRSCVAAFNIYKKAAVQSNQLSEFYCWCKYMGLFCEFYDHAFVDKIPEIQVIALERLVKGVWELTESSSSSTGSPLKEFSWSLTEDSSENTVACSEIVISSNGNWEKFEDDVLEKEVKNGDKIEPLIRFDEVDDNVGWETLLEASISPTCVLFRDNFLPNPNCHNYVVSWGSEYGYEEDGLGSQIGNNLDSGKCEETHGWQMQVYNPNFGLNIIPLYQQQNNSQDYGTSPTNPMYPWGI